MLGPFRIRNLRRANTQSQRRPRSPNQPPSPTLSRISWSDDAVVCIEGDQYDTTIESHPDAKLRYLDDDKDVITVGSKEELAQRLDEPIPALARSRPRVPSHLLPLRSSSSSMHVFEIDPLDATVEVWKKIEQQTKALLQDTANDNATEVVRTDRIGKGKEVDRGGEHPPKVQPAPTLPTSEGSKLDLATQDFWTAFLSSTPPEMLLAIDAGKEDAWRKNIRELHFQNSNPPRVDSTSTEKYPVLGIAMDSETYLTSTDIANDLYKATQAHDVLGHDFTSTTPVLTEAGRRTAQEMGQRLKSNQSIGLGPLKSESRTIDSEDAGNRWASYSTALQTSPTKIEKPRTQPFTEQLPQTVTSPLKESLEEPFPEMRASRLDSPSHPSGTLERSFFEKVQAQLAKLSGPDNAPSLDGNKENLPLQGSQSHSSRISREDYPLAESGGDDQEEAKPLLPSDSEEQSNEPSYTLLQSEASGNEYRNYDEEQLVSELIRRGIAPPSTTYDSLVSRLKDSLGKEEERSGSQRLSDPVEVTVGKMVMQMVSSVISNLDTLNSQIQGEARPQIPQEALRLRGYPDSAHADDMWRDIETLKDTFSEFDVATRDIMRSFERIHDHDEFPGGSGMLRLQGLSSTRGPLPQIATSLQNLVTGIQKTCIPAIGESNGRLQYHIPRRLATSGYEDTWELKIESIPSWVCQEYQVKDFVEKSLVECGIDLCIAKVRLDTTRCACFEVQGRSTADSVLRLLSASLWSGGPIDVSMQRKLYPSVFGAKSNKATSPVTAECPKFDISSSGTLRGVTPKPSIITHPELLEKRKAIQDRRAAWRKEYKARTQSVRFEEPSASKGVSAARTTTMSHSASSDIDATTRKLSMRPRGPITYRHVPSPIPNRDHSWRGRQSIVDRPLHRPYSYVAPTVPDDSRLGKRKSMPALQVRPRSRSRSRSPHNVHRRPGQLLRPSTSMHFDASRTRDNLEKLVEKKDPSEKSWWPFPQGGLDEDKLDLARKVSLDFWANQTKGHRERLNTSSFLPYSDRDPAGHIVFKPEPDLFKGKAAEKADITDSIARSDHQFAQGRVQRIPTLKEFETELAKELRFPPLPSMEPLEPLRLHPEPTHEQKDNSSLPRATPGAWPLEPEPIMHTAEIASVETVPGHASRRLFVGKIPLDLGEDWIREVFGPFGHLRTLVLAKDPWTGQSKGFCHVEYDNMADAVRACNAMSGMIIKNSSLYVTYSEPEDQERAKSTGISESSGAFSCRMMGRSPPLQFPGLPIASPEHKPQQQSESNEDVPALSAKPSIGLCRSATTVNRDSKTPTVSQGRRPYSMNFDGSGRLDWDNFTRPRQREGTLQTRQSNPNLGSSEPAAPTPERPRTTLFQNFNVPQDWRVRSRPVPAERPVSPIPSHDDPTTARVIEECVTKLNDLGYGGENGSKERLVVIAQAAGGDLEDAIDLIEEERSAWKERTES